MEETDRGTEHFQHKVGHTAKGNPVDQGQEQQEAQHGLVLCNHREAGVITVQHAQDLLRGFLRLFDQTQPAAQADGGGDDLLHSFRHEGERSQQAGNERKEQQAEISRVADGVQFHRTVGDENSQRQQDETGLHGDIRADCHCGGSPV